MISAPPPPKPKAPIIKITNDLSEVNELSRKGYALVDRYQNAIIVPVGCQNANGYTQELGQETNTYFVMELDAESAMAKIGEELEQGIQKLNNVNSELRKTKDELKESLKRERAATQAVDEYIKDNVTIRQEHDIAREQIRKMETDISKIRIAIGSERMNKILSEE